MGDFSARFHRPESGIHTVEGNVAGSKAAFLSQKRQRQQEEFEERKRQITGNSNSSSGGNHNLYGSSVSGSGAGGMMSSKFALATQEETLNAKTIGLVTAQDFVKATTTTTSSSSSDHPQEELSELQLQQRAAVHEEKERNIREKEAKKRKKKLKAKQKMMATLSFAHDEDADLFQDDHYVDDDNNNNNSNNNNMPKKSMGSVTLSSSSSVLSSKKDPTVDTSFLPDKARDEAIEAERRRLECEWKERQQRMKEETLEIVYSYWDGSGHRRTVQVQKGDTIGTFLELVRNDLSRDFREMQNIIHGPDALLYVKEDLILPQDLTFYDLIVTKARGKSGPLFHFDVHDDVRLGPLDARIEKDESHPGKVVERRWYDRNKHIFPASRWEVYDPNKDYGHYTIHGA